MGGFTSSRFWLTVLFYPILPLAGLLFLCTVAQALNLWIGLYPFVVAWTYDICAYFVGNLFGIHKICPSISPGKSWEGLGAGFVGALGANFLLIPLIEDFLPSSIPLILCYSVVGTFLAFSGDLFISYLKRQALLKDTGRMLPGHGGLLDRFDSVLFVGIGVLFGIWLFKFVLLGW